MTVGTLDARDGAALVRKAHNCKWTEDVWTIGRHLRIAAARYEQDAAENSVLRKHFEDQARQARLLAARFEDSDFALLCVRNG